MTGKHRLPQGTIPQLLEIKINDVHVHSDVRVQHLVCARSVEEVSVMVMRTVISVLQSV